LHKKNLLKCKDVTIEHLYRKIEYIISACQSLPKDQKTHRVFYLSGGIYQNRKTFVSMVKPYDIQISLLEKSRKQSNTLWKYFPVPFPLFFLLKINNVSELLEIIKELENPEIKIIYSFQDSFEKLFLDSFSFIDDSGFLMQKVRLLDSEHLLYMIDTDNIESMTGMLECYSVGKYINSKLKWFL